MSRKCPPLAHVLKAGIQLWHYEESVETLGGRVTGDCPSGGDWGPGHFFILLLLLAELSNYSVMWTVPLCAAHCRTQRMALLDLF